MAVDALFLRAQFEERVDVESFFLLDEAFHLHGPGADAHFAGVFCGIAFVGAKLVEIVVAGDVFEAGKRFAGGGVLAFYGSELVVCFGDAYLATRAFARLFRRWQRRPVWLPHPE